LLDRWLVLTALVEDFRGARLTVARDLSIVLSRDPGGTLSLGVEPLAGVA
jgi:hypothetical protein